MIQFRREVSWFERARANQLPVRVIGGSPRVRKHFRCPDCAGSWTDVEVAYQHVRAGCAERVA